MKRLFRKIPYNHRVAVVILLFTLVPCTILGVIHLQSERNKQKQALLSEYYALVDTTATTASKTIASMEAKMNYLLYDFDTYSPMSEINELSLSEKLDLINTMSKAVSIITMDTPNITARWYPSASTSNLGDYCQPLDVLASEFSSGASTSEFQELFEIADHELLWKARNIARQPDEQNAPQDRLCLYSCFSFLNRSNCILEVSLPATSFTTPAEEFLPTGSLLVICLNQNESFEYITLSSSLDSAQRHSLLSVYEQTGSLAEYEVIHSPITNRSNSNVLLLLPKAYVDGLLRPIIVEILLLYLIIVVVILCSSYLTSHLLTRKILQAIKEMRQDIAAVITQPAEDSSEPTDIQRISSQVKKLVNNTQDYCRKIDFYEKESVRLELELLQMRFNPHLLYNTLSAVNHHTKEKDARKAIISLCNYYRIVLHNGHLIISVHDEIEMVKEYLSIMKYTYCLDNITYQFDIDEDVMQYTIIKHILQPIVENAIHHGLRPRQQGGILRISGRLEEECLIIQVSDNGTGMNTEETASLLTQPMNDMHGGYGIFNAQRRLQLHYGKEYGLTIESAKGKGTCVTMRIPKMIPEEL